MSSTFNALMLLLVLTAPGCDTKSSERPPRIPDSAKATNTNNLVEDVVSESTDNISVHYVYKLDGVIKKDILLTSEIDYSNAIDKLSTVLSHADQVAFQSPVSVSDSIMVSVYVVNTRGVYHEFAVYSNIDFDGWAAGYGFYDYGAMGGYGYDDDDSIDGILRAFEYEFIPMLIQGNTPAGVVFQ